MRHWPRMHDRRAKLMVLVLPCPILFGCGFSPNASEPPIDVPPPPPDAAVVLDCNEIHLANPGLSSGTYRIDPDGPGGDDAYNVTCDMVAGGGGWTVVFLPSSNLASVSASYDAQITPALLTRAQAVLIAYRDTSKVAAPDYAAFAMPSDWRTQPPMNYAKTDLPTSVSINGAAEASATVRYGYEGFDKLCSDSWDTSAPWGRVCVVGTRAPYFAGFATTIDDTCSNSLSQYDAMTCATERRFSIAVR